MNWYKSNTGNHQGLVVDQDTGESIAVTYKKENAGLVAAAPELLAACQAMEMISSLWLPTETSPEHQGEGLALHSARVKMLNAIEKAEL